MSLHHRYRAIIRRHRPVVADFDVALDHPGAGVNLDGAVVRPEEVLLHDWEASVFHCVEDAVCEPGGVVAAADDVGAGRGRVETGSAGGPKHDLERAPGILAGMEVREGSDSVGVVQRDRDARPNTRGLQHRRAGVRCHDAEGARRDIHRLGIVAAEPPRASGRACLDGACAIEWTHAN